MLKGIIIVEQVENSSCLSTHSLNFRYTNHIQTFEGFGFPASLIV